MEKDMNGSFEFIGNPKAFANETSPLVLAYLGDAYFELLAREKLISEFGYGVAELSKKAKDYVTAISQSAACERLMPLLNEEEQAAYKRGRNAKSNHTPRSAPVSDYRKATGLEALFGWLYIRGEHRRARQLFNYCFPDSGETE